MAIDMIRIGTRGSELALWQAHWIQRELGRLHPHRAFEILIIKTKGDKILDSPLSKIGDKGLFTREIEQALLDKSIDLAVHSLKDLPTELPDGLQIGAISNREDVRDVFIPHAANSRRTLRDQEKGAKIATGSLRRKSQLLHLRPDFEIVDIRGNLNTRLKKLDESDWAGMMLAKAGVIRLGWENRIGETIEPDVILPAVGQGALAVEIRSGDEVVKELIRPLHHAQTFAAITAERALLHRLEGGCQVPIGTYARQGRSVDGKETLTLDAMVGSLDGRRVIKGSKTGSFSQSEHIGHELAEELLAKGAEAILQQIRTAGESPTGQVNV